MLNGYDWRKVVEEYLYKGEKPLGHCLISGRKFAEQSQNLNEPYSQLL